MKLFRSLLYILLLVVIVACVISSKTITKNSSKTNQSKKLKERYLFKKEPGKFYFTVLQLNDVYEIAPIQGGKYGGMARVETVHQELLNENPNTMLVLAGDFLNPSLLGTIKVDGERVRGKQMVEVMNTMNFDLVTFGNHEFDLSYNQLQNRLNESDFEWVSANVLHNKEGKSHYFHKIKDGKKEALNDSYIQEFYNGKNSLKVGFISVCLPSNPRSYVTYNDIYIEAERSYNEIKNQVDVVLGLTHVKIEEDREIAKMLPNLPLIMGGHEHTNNYETIGNVKIAKADANAKTVYIHRFEYDPLTKNTKLKSELKTIDDSILDDERVGGVVNKWQKILKTKIKEVVSNPEEVIYVAKEPLDARDTPVRSQQTNIGELIARAMSFAYKDKVDCALINGGSIRIDDVLTGEIDAVDIFRVLPYGGSILKIDIKGSLLNQVLDYGAKAVGTGAYLQHYDVSKVGEKWRVKNKPIEDNKTYSVAISDYLIKGFDIPFLKESNTEVIKVYIPKPEELAYDIRRAIIQYLKNQ
ncbi:2',3'-cyclic-nucleotide 2'-phosphodiesterase (5'-nucleotidase family) [Tenacibaculum adriaticum]|uniref:2',3'-cyclic-nucleotide 2'-phosphodiesterase (5'-nucleotidase family) n=1 Tax=Tenacibaculum adriaticum TaxID=413713 RepID=A0A5S5DSX3_9FLAO|nr:bifunctional metallophosphatase/5'-nucleotidase [Tenacibaculum adriaticum]TYP98784.1 2',3'-cyclic-nucleotide 2'-phosphodiesterase (5'-nucleotidase family) [Tenacibaculum adriaticum]